MTIAGNIAARFYLDWERSPSNRSNNVMLLHHLNGSLDIDRLTQAITRLMAIEPAFRTRFYRRDTNVCFEILANSTVSIEVLSLTQRPTPHGGPPQDLKVRLEALKENRFNLNQGETAHWLIASESATSHYLCLCMHHIVLDGSGIYVLYQTLEELYRNLELKASYDIQRQEQETLFRTCYARETHHERLAPESVAQRFPLPDLRTPLFPDTRRREGPVISLEFHLSDTQHHRVRKLREASHTTYFETVLAIWGLVVGRLSGTNQVTMTYPTNQRPRHLAPLVGCMVNMLPITFVIDEGGTLHRLMKVVKEARKFSKSLSTTDYRDVVQAWRQSAGAQLMLPNISIASTHLCYQPLELAPLKVTALKPPPIDALGDLHLEFDAKDSSHFRLNVDSSKYSKAFASTVVSHLQEIIEHLEPESNQPISDLLFPRAVLDSRLTLSPALRDQSFETDLLAPFQRALTQTPEKRAVQSQGESWNYAQLAAEANALRLELAPHLSSSNGHRPPVIATYGPPSNLTIASYLAILSMGCTVMPIRFGEPEERLKSILSTGKPTLLLTLNGVQAPFCESYTQLEIEPQPHRSSAQRLERADSVQPPRDAFLLFTSGSTGVPKGAFIPSAGILRLVQHNPKLDFVPSDIVAQSANLSFDASLLEIFGALLNGATLVVAPQYTTTSPEQLRQFLEDHAVTVLFLTTSVFHLHCELGPDTFSNLRLCIMGGDSLNRRALDQALKVTSTHSVSFVNVYGPTENSVVSTQWKLHPDAFEATNPPIGKPLRGTGVYILDSELRPLPIGVVGDIHLTGVGVSSELLDPPEQKPRLLAAPEAIAARDGFTTVYATGDRARWLPSGNLEFQGRIDSQIKMRGFRIELGEIEATMRRHPLVIEAAVLVGMDASGSKSIWAAYSSDGVDIDSISSQISMQLPDYMQPSKYRRYDQLPLNPRGKIDKSKLRRDFLNEIDLVRTASQPNNEWSTTEQIIADVWQRELGIKIVSPQADFFALGGHSLLAVRVAIEVTEKTGVPLDLAQVFEHRTIKSLASHIETQEVGLTKSLTTQPLGDDLPLLDGQQLHWLLQKQGKHFPTQLVLVLPQGIDLKKLQEAWNATVAHHEIFRLRLNEQSRSQSVVSSLALPLKTLLIPDIARAQLSKLIEDHLPKWPPADVVGDAHIFKSENGPSYLVLRLPHATTDGYSFQLIHQTLSAYYFNQEPPTKTSLKEFLTSPGLTPSQEETRRSMKFYQEFLNGDASYYLPRKVLASDPCLKEIILPAETDAKLQATASRLEIPVESVVRSLTLLFLHRRHRVPVMRCLSVMQGRETRLAQTVALLTARMYYLQSHWQPSSHPIDIIREQFEFHKRCLTYRHIPQTVLMSLSLRLFSGESLYPSHLYQWLGQRLCGRGVLSTDPKIAAFELGVAGSRLKLTLRRVMDWLRSPSKVRTIGCFINITTSLSAHDDARPTLGTSLRLRTPLPSTVPGAQYLEFFRSQEGIHALFQANLVEEEVERFTGALTESFAGDLEALERPLGPL